jgi:ABC-2 type transport system ATP-binding protein
LLDASSLRVDVGGSPAVDGLSMASTAERVLVLGAARALFEAAAGTRPVTRGTLRVAERDPLDAVRSGTSAGAPLDPPLPPGWTLRQYVEWSARLTGHSRGASRGLADEAIERLKLDALARNKLGTLAPAARRGGVLAAAIATAATVILVEDPTVGLSADAARSFARIVARALSDRRSIVFTGRASLDSPLALAADEAIVVSGSQVVAQGAPAEIAAGESAFLVRVGGDARAFVVAMEAKGGRVLAAAPEAARGCMTIDLGELKTLDLLRIAAEANAVVLELRPLASSFC